MKDKKIKKFDELSKDIESNELEIDFDKVKSGEIEIESIIDVFLDPKDIKENYIGLNYDLSKKELKRGDTFYITAMVKKKGTSINSPASQAVIKVRIIDIYNGLSYLNRVINK
jgi:hypothetical protein